MPEVSLHVNIALLLSVAIRQKNSNSKILLVCLNISFYTLDDHDVIQ